MGKKKLAVIDDSVIENETKVSKESNESKVKKQAATESDVIPTQVEESFDVEETTESAKVSKVEEKKEASGKTQIKKKATKQEKKAKKVRGKKYQEKRELVERNKLYPITEATELVKQASYSTFDGTLEIHINTSQKGVRGLISLPFATGKKLKIIAFGPPSLKASEGQVKEFEEQGVMIGDDEALNEIIKGKINFDVLVTTADWMPKLARAAKVLGPKGLMPNPKNGTITTDLKKTVMELQGGKVEYKTEAKANVIHLGIGKVSQPQDELNQNIKLLLSTIGKTRIKKAVISPTMGPGIKLDLSSI